MRARVPFIIPEKASYLLGRMFTGLMQPITKLMPELGENLAMLEAGRDDAEYLGAVLVNAVFVGLIIGAVFYLVAARMEVDASTRELGSIVAGAALMLITSLYLMLYPTWVVKKMAGEMEENLLFAIRHIMVQTTAGVSFFDALSSASTGYGAVSAEFRNIMNEVNGGRDLTDALDESAARSPSKYYKRIIWHVSNSTRSGYDPGDVLKELVTYLSYEQQIRMKKFGSELNVISLFYLTTCIIMPTMGLILSLILSSFSIVSLNSTLLGLFVFVIAVFNMLFLGMIQSRRPRGIL